MSEAISSTPRCGRQQRIRHGQPAAKPQAPATLPGPQPPPTNPGPVPSAGAAKQQPAQRTARMPQRHPQPNLSNALSLEGLAEQDCGRGVPVGHAFDVHGYDSNGHIESYQFDTIFITWVHISIRQSRQPPCCQWITASEARISLEVRASARRKRACHGKVLKLRPGRPVSGIGSPTARDPGRSLQPGALPTRLNHRSHHSRPNSQEALQCAAEMAKYSYSL